MFALPLVLLYVIHIISCVVDWGALWCKNVPFTCSLETNIIFICYHFHQYYHDNHNDCSAIPSPLHVWPLLNRGPATVPSGRSFIMLVYTEPNKADIQYFCLSIFRNHPGVPDVTFTTTSPPVPHFYTHVDSDLLTLLSCRRINNATPHLSL